MHKNANEWYGIIKQKLSIAIAFRMSLLVACVKGGGPLDILDFLQNKFYSINHRSTY